ncbi:hypothetical protein AB0H36_43935 [Kribbella sp. NPDC050820]|uniref:hypothetical protein n=1 Tax=Kribbella sp. NPDC050820 TaxID=3155408 RepID=UPI0033D54B5A
MRIRAGLALLAAGFFSLAGTALPAGASALAPAATTGQAASPPSSVQAPAADPSPGVKKYFTMRDERITESSGLAKSQKYDLWWTVNDSGDRARVFGVDNTGKVRMVLGFKADVQDVEAVAVDGDGTIYIADIGDAKGNRDQIEIYTIPEPADLADNTNVTYHRYDFTYPDGAHDAETLLVEPGTNQLFIVTKSSKGAGSIYAAPPAPSRQGTNELTKLAPAPAGTFTDGTFLPDGQRVVLRTYTGIATIAWGEPPTLVASATVSASQGESVAVGPDGQTVLAGTEGADSPVYQVLIPAKKAAATPPAASATPKPGTGNDSSTESAKSNNLRWILIGAAAFALLITIITFPPGRRERLDRMAENARLTGQSPPTPHRRSHS